MHHLSAILGVYITLRQLPPHRRPALLVRDAARALIVCHPGTPRSELVCWCVDNLTDDEQNELRRRLGQPAVGQPLDDWLFTGEMTSVMPACRLDAEMNSYPHRADWPHREIAA